MRYVFEGFVILKNHLKTMGMMACVTSLMGCFDPGIDDAKCHDGLLNLSGWTLVIADEFG